ncbi:MAG: YCF48-related protein [Ignavibacteria bacterium]|nr:YCF48-related protein [Ignavibacteria bacterium]
MKRIYYFLTLAILLSVNIHSQEWRVAVTETLPIINGSHFLTTSLGYCVGDGGAVRKTTDSGVNWSLLAPAGTAKLWKAYFLNELFGFVGDNAALIHKTTDGGLSWTAIPVTGGSGEVTGIHFLNENTGWVSTSTSSVGKVLYTTDGGNNWTTVVDNPTGSLDALKIYNGTTGIVCGGKMDIYYTANGTTWTRAIPPTLPPGYSRSDLRAIHIQDANLAYLVGWGSLIGLQASIHAKSTDGGATWTFLAQQAENKTYDNLWGVYFKDANNGIATGGATRGTVCVRTNDGGINWIPINIPCGGTLKSIDGFGDEVIISGSNYVLKSTDFGTTWQRMNPIPGLSLYAMHSIGENFIVAAGFDAVFLKSVDGGRNWSASTIRANNAAPNAQDIFFVNENVGYASHGYGMISKTTDGGNSWFQVMKDTIAVGWTNYGIHFLDENYGFVVAKTANNVDGIFKTTDGGASWLMKENIFATNLRGVAFTDQNIGVVVGEKYKIGFTTDGGVNWTPATLPTITGTPNFRDVSFINSNTVIAVGDAMVMVSNDAGKNWSNSGATVPEVLTGLEFKDPTNGWAVGAKTSPRSIALLYTSDGGVNWTNRVDYSVFDTMKTVTDVAYNSAGNAFICASSSTIYTNALPDGITKELGQPKGFSLQQNYPNPFNPETVIRFEIITADIVNLKIYDILGNEVAELVNEFKQPGIYSVSFNAINSTTKELSSGVYFYNIKSGNNSLVRKMMLIK